MAKLVWDQIGEKKYETGTDHGVLYPLLKTGIYDKGVAWNGLTAVTESPSGAEETPLYADNIKYASLRSAEEFAATIEAFTYPDAFAACDGSASIGGVDSGVTVGQQPRQSFGFCYRTLIGNDAAGQDAGYKLHLVYGATAAPSEKNYATVNDSPEAITLSWEITTIPVEIPGLKPSAILTIDSTKVEAAKLTQIEELLYGNGTTGEPTLPLPADIIAILEGPTPPPAG